MSYPAIGAIIFKAHKDEEHQNFWLSTAIWTGLFLSKVGMASPLKIVGLFGNLMYICGLLFVLPYIAMKTNKGKGVAECGRVYAHFLGMVSAPARLFHPGHHATARVMRPRTANARPLLPRARQNFARSPGGEG